MRSLALPVLLTLASCSAVENTFTVEDEQGSVRSANLVLCGSTTPIQRQGGRFTASEPINCEGSGYIQVTYAAGDQRNCPVGYVTPGSTQVFAFRASECQPIIYKVSAHPNKSAEGAFPDTPTLQLPLFLD